MSNTPILDKLAEERVVYLAPKLDEKGTGKIQIMEACDDYYSVELTKEEYIALGNEILEQAKLLWLEKATADLDALLRNLAQETFNSVTTPITLYELKAIDVINKHHLLREK